MTDDHERLRQAMTSLAEHGGAADLYDRVLLTSRRSSRRRTIATTAGITAAVAAITAPIALTQLGRGDIGTPGNTRAPVLPGAGPDSPTASAGPSTSPSRPAGPCPVTAETLGEVAGLETGYRIDGSSIACWQTWAIAAVTAPTAADQGDGSILFSYDTTSGAWRKVKDGSEFYCDDDLGLAKTAEHPAWCFYAN